MGNQINSAACPVEPTPILLIPKRLSKQVFILPILAATLCLIAPSAAAHSQDRQTHAAVAGPPANSELPSDPALVQVPVPVLTSAPVSALSVDLTQPSTSVPTADTTPELESEPKPEPDLEPAFASSDSGFAGGWGGRSKKPAQPKTPPAVDISVFGTDSYGNWQIFAAGIWEHLYIVSVEYDRNSWGRFLGARMDYAADIQPLILLREPAVLNKYGIRRSKKNTTLPGAGFSPIGLHMLWRENKRIKPFFVVKGGAVGFTQKALSPAATYWDFSLHENIGVAVKMTEKLDLRLGLFGDFHFSNAYVVDYNPGLDVMNSNIGITYHMR